MKILILGGTGEARELAGRLVALGHAGHHVAGRADERADAAWRAISGLANSAASAGLVGYLQARGFDLLVDATHPYAGLISINAVAASERTKIPLVRFMRPAWPEDADWLNVTDLEAAAKALPSGATAMITTGHEGLSTFLARDDCTLVIRLIEPPEMILPRHARLILGRPPYSVAGEKALMQREAITHLVSKNSGGAQTAAKLEAAKALGVDVIMIARPVHGPAIEVATIEDAIAALKLER